MKSLVAVSGRLPARVAIRVDAGVNVHDTFDIQRQSVDLIHQFIVWPG
jgi:hypothetical protein